ncbi:F0F1 ATP synthase subunit B [Candidatus Auribacterota bacterium]
MIELNFTYVMQMINFLILMGLMYKFLYKPILKLLDDRTKKINKSIDDALEAKHKATELYDRCVSELNRVQEDSLKIKEQAKHIGNNEKEKIVAEAGKEAEYILTQAKKEISQELTKTKEELKHNIGELSIKISEKIIKENLSTKGKENIAEKYIEEIEAL